MIPKLQEYLNEKRIPLFIREKNNILYFQLQIEVAREDGLCAGMYCEYEKVQANDAETIGKAAKKMLARFHEISDLSAPEFQDLTGMSIESYKIHEHEERMKKLEAKSEKELNESFDECSISYEVKNDRYSFNLSWIYQECRKKWRDSCDSTGKQGIYTFEKPLGFDDDIAPICLGEMILEAFKRSRKMARVMTRGTGLPKEIYLFEGTIVEVISPKDKHFADYDDAGAGEIYQDYAYIAREGARSSADFMLTMAPELHGAISCDNIRSAWTEAFGKADELQVSETEYGIFKYRAELKNKKMYRIAYFRELNDGTALECCLEITDPDKKKKLVDKLPALFENFVLKCKIRNG